MATYGLSRASSKKQEQSLEQQADAIRTCCLAKGLGEPTILDEPLGTSGRTTAFKDRPKGKWLLQNVAASDVIVVTKLDRLGRNARDILGTIERFSERGVRIIIMQFLGAEIDMESSVGRMIVLFYAGFAQLEGDLISDRTREAFAYMKAAGMRIRVSWGEKRTIIDGRSRVVWDNEQLEYCYQVALMRAKRMSWNKIAAHIKENGWLDQRGKPFCLAAEGSQNPNYLFHRCLQRFHRMRYDGLLPMPWLELANHIPHVERFKPRTNRKWTERVKKVRDNKPDRTAWTAEQWRDWYEKAGRTD